MRFTYRAVLGLIIFLLTLLATVVALLQIGKSMQFERPNFSGRDFERTWSVTTLSLQKSTVTPFIEGFGTIVAQDVSTVRPAVAGVTQSKPFTLRNGSYVTAGELLFELDPFSFQTSVSEAEITLAEAVNNKRRLQIDLKNAEAQIAIAERASQLARQNLTRQQQLQTQAVVSSSAVENAQNNLLTVNSTLESRRLAVETAQTQLTAQDLVIERAELSLARTLKALEDASIKAPISGIVSELNIVVGSPVTQNEPLLTITDPSTYQVKFQLSDAEYGRFFNEEYGLIGRRVTVIWETGYESIRYNATVAEISAVVEQSNGGIDVLADLEGLERETPLRQGTFVSVRIQEKDLMDVYQLPTAAVSEQGGVFVIQNGRLKEIFGNVLRRISDQIIIDLPLAEGVEIVEKRYGQLAPGIRVEIINPNETENNMDPAVAGTPSVMESNDTDRYYRITPDQAEQARTILANVPIPEERKALIFSALDQLLMPEMMATRMGSRLGIDVANAQVVIGLSVDLQNSATSQNDAAIGNVDARPASAVPTSPNLIDITPEQAARAIILLETLPIPEERRATILEALQANTIPERLAMRIADQIDL